MSNGNERLLELAGRHVFSHALAEFYICVEDIPLWFLFLVFFSEFCF